MTRKSCGLCLSWTNSINFKILRKCILMLPNRESKWCGIYTFGTFSGSFAPQIFIACSIFIAPSEVIGLLPSYNIQQTTISFTGIGYFLICLATALMIAISDLGLTQNYFWGKLILWCVVFISITFVTRFINVSNGLFPPTETETEMETDSKPDGYIVLCRTFSTDSDLDTDPCMETFPDGYCTHFRDRSPSQ